MAQAAVASTVDYRTAQQSHHQKILSQLLGSQQRASPAMFVDTNVNTLGISAAPDHYSVPSPSHAPSGSDPHRSSTSSSQSSGSSNTYLQSPHPDHRIPPRMDAPYDPSWNSTGWAEMTFGMVAQAQANLAMNMNHANNFPADKYAPQTWAAPQQSIAPGYLQQPTISIDQYQSPYMYGQVPPSTSFAPTFAPSPLRSVSPASKADEDESASDTHSDDGGLRETVSDLDSAGGPKRRSTRLRERSDSDFILESPGAAKRPSRRLTWTSTNDRRQAEFEAEIGKREVERLREMERFEETNGKGNRKERRRLQNRLAQRAFRARSKIQGKEFNEHLGDLESITIDQADRIKQLTQIVDRLQKENAALKAGRWAAFQGIPQSTQQHTSEGRRRNA